MEEEKKEQVIPDYQGPVADIPPVEEQQEQTQTETITETETVTASEESAESSTERLRLENEAFKNHFSELNREMEEISKKFQTEDGKDSDPVSVLSGEIDELKSGFNELKSILEKKESAGQAQAQPQMQQQVPQFAPQMGNPFFPYGYGAPQMFSPGPMYQTSTILPAPALPYFQTPNFYPMNTTLPTINAGTGNNKSGGK